MSASLTAEQTAQRLGVKIATLYAYVSRGLLPRTRTPSGSMFDPLEVEAFAARRRRTATPDTVRAAGSPLMVIDTDVAVVLDGELFFRGRSAARWALQSTLPALARELWGFTGAWPVPDRVDRTHIRRAVGALPEHASPVDRLRTAVTVLAATDPLRGDASAASVRRAGARMLAQLPDALDGEIDIDWSPAPPGPDDPCRRALQAALILTVDHDLAVSTMAARMAATARGSGYAMVSAALGAFDSPLHGTAAEPACAMLRDVVAGAGAEAGIAAAVARSSRGVPGFGQPLYAGIDARAATLLPLVFAIPGTEDLRNAVTALAEVMARRAGLHPNLDLALAAYTLAARVPAATATAIFALGRVVGWIAHGLAEYGEPPMRLRPRGRYVGPLP